MNTAILKKIALVLGILALLGGLGYVAFTNDLLPTPSSNDLAARVNNEEIKKEVLEEHFEQTKAAYEEQGIVLAEQDLELLRQKILSDVITEVLLLQYANEKNIAAEESTIETEYQKVVATFPTTEEFQNALEMQQMTEQELRERISQQLTIQRIVEEQAPHDSITIAEEELRKAYDDAVAAGEEVPSFEEAQGDIEEFVRQQKIGEIMNVFIDQLRAEASVEILV